jgi:hypothetical protein
MTRLINDTLLMDNPITCGGMRIELFNAILSNAAVVRNAAADISINVAASQNALMTFDLGGTVIKYINSLLTTTSNPPVAADGTLLGTGEAPIAKGFKITDITVAYSIQGAGLTSQSLRFDRNVYANGVANAITNILANGANGLTTAATASATTCAVVKVPVNTTFDILDNDALIAELNVVTPAAVTYRLYEMFIHGSFNYN